MRIDPNTVVHRVHEEVVRRRDAGNATSVAPFQQHLHPDQFDWVRSAQPLPMKEQYELSELLAYSDVAFIEACYFAVLRRSPDEVGMASYLNPLRSGAMSKVEVVAALRWSPEGNSKGVHVNGLLIPYTVQKWRRKRFIGPLVGYVQGLVRLPRLFDQIAVLDARQARDLQGLGEFVNAVNLRLDDTVRELERSLNDVSQPRFDMLERMAGEAVKRDSELAKSFDERSGGLEDAIGQQQVRYEVLLRELVSRVNADIARLRETLEGQIARITLQESDAASRKFQLETIAGEVAAIGNEKRQRRELERELDPLYVAFEEKFRGTRELIRQRVEPYVAVMQDAQVGTRLAPILDIGCGRGDLIDILRENDLIARGVDSNRIFVDLCRARGLDVVEGDALEMLRSLPDASLGAVTGLHIAEHLPFEILISLIDECRRVLCIGGVLLLETPNPENLLVATQFFYMDPTHRNPLPPEALQWFVEARGFERVRIERLSLARSLGVPPLLNEEIPGAGSINFLLSQAHAAPDYAVIARRL